jgi:hypothetical protein
MATTSLKLREKSVDNLVIFSRNVHDHMLAAAATFVTPPVTMADLGKHTDDLEKAQSDAVKGNHTTILNRDIKRVIVESDLKALADYVDMTAKGDVTIIDKAGMDIRKQGVNNKSPLVNKPVIKSIDSKNKGTLTVKWYGLSRSVTYALEYTNDLISNVWNNGTYSTSKSAIIDNLNSDTRYWVRVAALSTNGLKSDWSDPATHMVE